MKSQIPPISSEEVEHAVKSLKTGKAKDSAGILAEMVKDVGNSLIGILTDLYNNILHDSAIPPKRWRESIISVLHKSGSPELPESYRPITIIPILYKLFARLLYNRLEPLLDRQQSRDQAGFRKGFRTTDHL